jgi:polygalacturonase
MYQDFGHSHWHNSLIWGVEVEDVSITGPGRIEGTGLTRRGPGPRRKEKAGDTPTTLKDATAAARAVDPEGKGVGKDEFLAMVGEGNKAIALKLCRNITLRDFTISKGGHFALLATGVDDLVIERVTVDSQRDGFDIDACRRVRIADCAVNTPSDDAIVLKSSFALGYTLPTENVEIVKCQVSGFDLGTLLDGTRGRTQELAPDLDRVTGRIKFGTESNGGFKNIAISNCVFVRSRGLAIESVDGAIIEDVAISNITMRDVSNSAIFLRLGNRARGPEGTPVGAIRRVTISHVVASNVDARYPIIIAGLPGHPIEDVKLTDIRVVSRGGLSLDDVAKQAPELVNTFFLRGPGLGGPHDPFTPPEQEKGYPEPSMFGLLPAYGMFVWHAKNLTVDQLDVGYAKEDTRPAVVLMDVAGIEFSRTRAQRAAKAPLFVLRGVKDFSALGSAGLADTKRDTADNESF